MSVHWEEPGQRWVVRFQDIDGKQRSVTANASNFVKYELPVPERITRRVVRRLEAEVLRRETAADGSIRSADRRKTMYLDERGVAIGWALNLERGLLVLFGLRESCPLSLPPLGSGCYTHNFHFNLPPLNMNRHL